MAIEFAKRLCPDRIMQPHPLSDEKSPWSPSWLFSLIENDKAEVACGLVDLGIGSNSDLYVIQNLDSKSARNAGGQPPSVAGSSYASDEEKLLDIDSGGVSGAFAGGGGAGGRGDGLVSFISDSRLDPRLDSRVDSRLDSSIGAAGGVWGPLSTVFAGVASLSLY